MRGFRGGKLEGERGSRKREKGTEIAELFEIKQVFPPKGRMIGQRRG